MICSLWGGALRGFILTVIRAAEGRREEHLEKGVEKLQNS